MTTTAPTTASSAKPSKAIHITLWVLQVALGAMFVLSGGMKATQPIAGLAEAMVWPGAVPALVRFIGVAEFLGGLGLILPAATRINPSLTPLAAIGLLTTWSSQRSFTSVEVSSQRSRRTRSSLASLA